MSFSGWTNTTVHTSIASREQSMNRMGQNGGSRLAGYESASPSLSPFAAATSLGSGTICDTRIGGAMPLIAAKNSSLRWYTEATTRSRHAVKHRCTDPRPARLYTSKRTEQNPGVRWNSDQDHLLLTLYTTVQQPNDSTLSPTTAHRYGVA